MIRGAHIRGFKRFADERFTLAPLTILTGMNGSGKTTFLQGILVAHEASRTSTAAVRLNGPFSLALGTAGDVLNWKSESPIEIALEWEQSSVSKWRFNVPSDDSLYLTIAERPENTPNMFLANARAFTYLSAERLGPRGVLETSPLPDYELAIGVHGEYCAHVLSALGDKIIENHDRSHPLNKNTIPRLLKYEVEQWLSEVTRPIEVMGKRDPGSTVAELRYRVQGPTWVRSTNMGFGITYSLPVILAGLIADPDGLLIIENPEAHLHPAGQSRMGMFLAWLAGLGVQCIIETHSDHVINGIRRAIAELQYIEPREVIIHYFETSEHEEFQPNFQTLSVTELGGLSSWPRGFFDQYQIDVASLGNFRRRSR